MDDATRPVGDHDPWRRPWQPPQPEAPAAAEQPTQPVVQPVVQPAWGQSQGPARDQQQAQQPRPHPAWQQAQPAWQQAAPVPQPGWQQPDPWAPREPVGNPIAVWSWVVAVPCAVLGIVFGAVGLSRARRRGGAGQGHAIAGLVLSGVTVLFCVVALPVLGGLALLGAEDGWSGGGDGTVSSPTAQEQAFLDGIGDDTYSYYSDETLLLMGQEFCDALDGGAAPPEADQQLLDDWTDVGLTLDEAYDVETSATSSLCPVHADDFSAWDPEETDGGGGAQVLDPTGDALWQA